MFDLPKPTSFLEIWLVWVLKSGMILDFFGGCYDGGRSYAIECGRWWKSSVYLISTLDEEVASKSALLLRSRLWPLTKFHVSGFVIAAAKIQEEHSELAGKQDFGFQPIS